MIILKPEQLGGRVSGAQERYVYRSRVVGANPAMEVPKGFLEGGSASSPRAGWYKSNS